MSSIVMMGAYLTAVDAHDPSIAYYSRDVCVLQVHLQCHTWHQWTLSRRSWMNREGALRSERNRACGHLVFVRYRLRSLEHVEY